jgi:hypothetical protein
MGFEQSKIVSAFVKITFPQSKPPRNIDYLVTNFEQPHPLAIDRLHNRHLRDRIRSIADPISASHVEILLRVLETPSKKKLHNGASNATPTWS